MQISETKFWSGWGLYVVLVAIALPILGMAYLVWTVMPGAAEVSSTPPTAQSVHWRAADVIGAFHAAHLNAEVVHDTSKQEQDGMFPGTGVDARHFQISAKAGEMGTVLSFENARDMAQIRNYYLQLNRSLPQFRSWLYVKDNILLQINHEVPERDALAYACILDTLDQ